MKIAKKAAVVLCAGLLLISPGVASQPAYGEFPATLTVKAATVIDLSTLTGDYTISDNGEYTVTGTTTTHRITIEGGAPTVTVEDVNITLDQGCPLTVHSDDFTLIIKGVNTFKSGNCAGIDVAGGNQITIKEDEDVKGTLNAIGGNQSSGIGGGVWGDGGTIIIESGTINATGGSYGAGIGGGRYKGGGDVIVKGGIVNATGGNNGAGIGSGGDGGNGGSFTIYGGTVTAAGGGSAAGIGGGNGGAGGKVTVNGGTVTANGGGNGAGIGGGSGGAGGTVLVNDGTVTATGGNNGAGIGGGSGSAGGDFTINKGNVTAATGGNGEDIGHGSGSSKSGTAAYNGGTVNNVSYTPSSYTVTIPAAVELGKSVDIEVSDVVLGDYKAVDVKLIKASGTGNKLTLTANGEEITYTIKKNGENGDEVNVGDTILSATEDSSVKLYFTKPTTTPKYTGNYTGTVMFVFKWSS